MQKYLRWIVGLVATTPLFAPPTVTAAGDHASLYDDVTLLTWQPRYQRGLERVYREVIWPSLTTEERRRVENVRIELPLRVPNLEPFAYYAGGVPPTVTLSVHSMKFFDDFSSALAWLNRKGYGVETPFEYIEVMKYRSASELGGRYPPPLEALGIPANALEDRDVYDLTNAIFDSAIGFVLLHELGHVVHGHPGYGPGVRREDARDNEMQADRFALDVMRRTRSLPTGMAFFFPALGYGGAHRGDFQSDADYETALLEATHPLTEDRLQALAANVRQHAGEVAGSDGGTAIDPQTILFIADQLDIVAHFLGDSELQRFRTRRARETTIAMLAPRRPNELPDPTSPRGVEQAGLVAFQGTYTGAISASGTEVPIRTVLRRSGDRVSGEYYYGPGEGRLHGRVDGNTLTFVWQEGTLTGLGAFQVSEDGKSFSGTWGYARSATDGGFWTGRQ